MRILFLCRGLVNAITGRQQFKAQEIFTTPFSMHLNDEMHAVTHDEKLASSFSMAPGGDIHND